jgi:hypothetical protein
MPSTSTNIDKLIEHVDEISQHLKEAKKDLTSALEATDLYQKILTATLKQTSTGCKMPDKVAKAHALKVTLANFKKEAPSKNDA